MFSRRGLSLWEKSNKPGTNTEELNLFSYGHTICFASAVVIYIYILCIFMKNQYHLNDEYHDWPKDWYYDKIFYKITFLTIRNLKKICYCYVRKQFLHYHNILNTYTMYTYKYLLYMHFYIGIFLWLLTIIKVNR